MAARRAQPIVDIPDLAREYANSGMSTIPLPTLPFLGAAWFAGERIFYFPARTQLVPMWLSFSQTPSCASLRGFQALKAIVLGLRS